MASLVENSLIKATDAEIFATPTKIHQVSSSISKVRVIVRIRPFLPREVSSRNGNPIPCVSLQESESSYDDVTVLLKDNQSSRNECYKLDAYFGQEDNNVSQIFEREVKPLIPGLFQGYNATVFAYGATGSGKTYTMQGSDELPGLMPLALSSILSMSKSTGSTVSISYYEIYLDKCYDLLELKEKEILVWNDKDGHMHLKGLAEIEVNSTAKFHDIFSSALQRRKVAHTGLNDVSSRSHGVLAIKISTQPHDSVGNIITGKLNLIDLAGNEDNRRTCNEGIRLQESSKINQSLFVLSNVIYALNNNKPRIPYRESKLTRILQDSLGGTSRALMVACLNPGEYQESVHTVSLAARSRHVSNFVPSAQKNVSSNMKVDMDAKLLKWLESKGKTKSAQRTGLANSLFVGKTPGSVKSTKRFNVFTVSQETKAVRDQGGINSKQRRECLAGRNLFNVTAADTNKEKLATPVCDESSFGDEKQTIEKGFDALCLSPPNGKTQAPQSSQREALSPINSNIEKPQLIPLEPKTPMSHSMQSDGQNNFQVLGTPLDKFIARSSNLKSSLVQDYIEFLNTASREELVELKGVGQKIAEYILELRETSPLKSLSDLEKIGLSSKQVHNMFGRAARGVLEKIVCDK